MTAQELFEKALQNLESNSVAAFRYLTQAADIGHGSSLEMLANIHETGRCPIGEIPEGAIRFDPKKAVYCYEILAVEHNSARAMMKLGMFYCSGKCESGSIGTRDFERGREFIKQGYRLANPDDPLDQKLCIDLGLFVGQGKSNEDGRSDIRDIKLCIALLNKGLKNEANLEEFYEDEGIKEIKKYRQNRRELLENEKSLSDSEKKHNDSRIRRPLPETQINIAKYQAGASFNKTLIARWVAIVGIAAMLILVIAIFININSNSDNANANYSDNGSNFVSDSANSGNSNNRNDSNGANDNSGNKSKMPVVPVKYIDGYDFSGGVAWVQTSERLWRCVDKTGNSILQLEQGEKPASNFSLGVALIVRSNKTIELVDKNGEIISSPTSGDYDEICGFIPELGMTLVYKKVITFELTEDQVGVINNKGEWQVHLTNNSALVKSRVSIENTLDSLMNTRNHLGEGVISAVLNPYGYRPDGETSIYNIYTGDSYSIKYYSYDFTAWSSGSLKHIENGYGVFFTGGVYVYEAVIGSVFAISSNGQETEIMVDAGFKKAFNDSEVLKLGKYRDGLFYYQSNNTVTASQFSKGSINYRQGFYNINGDLVIDLSDYIIDSSYNNPLPEFTDGYCLLSLNNPQGTRFFTIIDKNGNQMFEPIYNANSALSSLSLNCGLVVFRKEDGSYAVIDTSGNNVADLGKVRSVSNYSDDAALVKGDNEIYYIDKAGNRLF